METGIENQGDSAEATEAGDDVGQGIAVLSAHPAEDPGSRGLCSNHNDVH